MEYVILDIETTGLDPEYASVIEVGAIIIRNNKIAERFSSFIEYKEAIPETVKRITGISEDMLLGAPPLETVLGQLKEFIGKLPVVSHNGFSFDFPMLERHGVKFEEKYDSIELSFFVMPTYPYGHSMDALSQYFKLSPVKHRALSDCEEELEVIRKLQVEFSKRPKKKREALKSIAQEVNWWWAQFLNVEAVDIGLISNLVDKYEPYRKENAKQEVLDLGVQPIDLAEVDSKFQISTAGSDYTEERPEQRKMAALVAQAFNNKQHAVIEAGTGTGKSKAYLVPSLLFALKNGIPLIISTHTKALQDQLFFKEIPHLRKIINEDLRVAVLKGKQNYVCVKKFEEFAEEVVTTLTQRSLYEFGKDGTHFTTRLAYLLLASWIAETERGDWDELPYWLKARMPKKVELEICNLDELCGSGTCDLYDDQRCFLARARMRAKDSDLVIINHALALAGIMIDETPKNEDPEMQKPAAGLRHSIFPTEARYIVFDEAHHLEDNATGAWEARISNGVLQLLLQQLFGKRSAKSMISSLAKRSEKMADLAKRFENQEGDIKVLAKLLFEDHLPRLMSGKPGGSFPDYCVLDTLSDELKKPVFEVLGQLTLKLEEIAKVISSIMEDIDEARITRSLTIRANGVHRVIKALQVLVDTNTNYIRYLERARQIIEIKATPISLAEHIKKYVLDNFSSVVMTSATLTVNNSFRFYAERCGILLLEKGKAICQRFSSSFNYAKQVKFFATKGIAYESKKQDEHFEKSVAFLEKATIASSGGSLILCSSHEQVKKIYDRLIGPLSKNNIWLLKQSPETSVNSVIRDFQKDVNSVLIGTETLWQGIDVPGESLRSLFIYKIPFRMPEIPIIKARCDVIRKASGNWFAEYYEPLAAIILKQGFGRLIRKSTDIGVAVLLDETIMERKREGIRQSLPEGVKVLLAEPEVICDELHRVAELAADGKFTIDHFSGNIVKPIEKV